jgi:hypothetical protein
MLLFHQLAIFKKEVFDQFVRPGRKKFVHKNGLLAREG